MSPCFHSIPPKIPPQYPFMTITINNNSIQWNILRRMSSVWRLLLFHGQIYNIRFENLSKISINWDNSALFRFLKWQTQSWLSCCHHCYSWRVKHGHLCQMSPQLVSISKDLELCDKKFWIKQLYCTSYSNLMNFRQIFECIQQC